MADWKDNIPTPYSDYGIGESPAVSNPDFYEKMPNPFEPEPESSLLRRAVVDPLVGLARGTFVGIPEAAVGLADIPTMGEAGKTVESVGRNLGIGGFKEGREFFDQMLTPETREAQQEVADTKGFLPTVGAALEHPSVIAQTVAESIPSMVGGAGLVNLGARALGKGAVKIAPELLAKMGGITKLSEATTPAQAEAFKAVDAIRKSNLAKQITSGAIAEGAVTAGQNLEQVRQQTPDQLLTGEQIALNVAAGTVTGVLGALGGKLAERLKLADPNTMASMLTNGGLARTVAEKQTWKQSLINLMKTMVKEGMIEELPQSIQEQIAQNLSLNKPWDEGAWEAGALGMLAGMAQGGGAHVIDRVLSRDPIHTDINKQIADLGGEQSLKVDVAGDEERTRFNEHLARIQAAKERVVEDSVEDVAGYHWTSEDGSKEGFIPVTNPEEAEATYNNAVAAAMGLPWQETVQTDTAVRPEATQTKKPTPEESATEEPEKKLDSVAGDSLVSSLLSPKKKELGITPIEEGGMHQTYSNEGIPPTTTGEVPKVEAKVEAAPTAKGIELENASKVETQKDTVVSADEEAAILTELPKRISENTITEKELAYLAETFQTTSPKIAQMATDGLTSMALSKVSGDITQVKYADLKKALAVLPEGVAATKIKAEMKRRNETVAEQTFTVTVPDNDWEARAAAHQRAIETKTPYVAPTKTVTLTPAEYAKYKEQQAALEKEQKDKRDAAKKEEAQFLQRQNSVYYQTIEALPDGVLKMALQRIYTHGLKTETISVQRLSKRNGRNYLVKGTRQIVPGLKGETDELKYALHKKYGFPLNKGITKNGKYTLDELADEIWGEMNPDASSETADNTNKLDADELYQIIVHGRGAKVRGKGLDKKSSESHDSFYEASLKDIEDEHDRQLIERMENEELRKIEQTEPGGIQDSREDINEAVFGEIKQKYVPSGKTPDEIFAEIRDIMERETARLAQLDALAEEAWLDREEKAVETGIPLPKTSKEEPDIKAATRASREPSITRTKILMGRNSNWDNFVQKLKKFLRIAPTDKAWKVPKAWQYAFMRATGWTHLDAVKKLDLPLEFSLNPQKELTRNRKDIYASAAWHGGHKFDKFKLDESTARTGTGGMSQGYGLYFADLKAVGEYYKNELKSTFFDFQEWLENTERIDEVVDAIFDGLPTKSWDKNQGSLFSGNVPNPSATYVTLSSEYALSQKETPYWTRQNFRNWYKESDAVRDYGNIKDLFTRGQLKAMFLKLRPKTALYKVELAPQQDEYLLWDEPFSKQSDKVKAALRNIPDAELSDEKKRANKVLDDMMAAGTLPVLPDGATFSRHLPYGIKPLLDDNANGAIIYKAVAQLFQGSEKKASEYLHSIGIRGNKYRDNVSREKVENSRARTYNYVIFSDKDVEIKKIFASITGIDKRAFDQAIMADKVDSADLEMYRKTLLNKLSLSKEDYEMVGQQLTDEIKNLKGGIYEEQKADSTDSNKGRVSSVSSIEEGRQRSLARTRDVIIQENNSDSIDDRIIEDIKKDRLISTAIATFKVERARVEQREKEHRKQLLGLKKKGKSVDDDITREVAIRREKVAKIDQAIQELTKLISDPITHDSEAYTTKVGAEASELGRTHGYKVIFIKDKYHTLSGFVNLPAMEIYVNIHSGDDPVETVGHEISHLTNVIPIEGVMTNAEVAARIDEKSKAFKTYHENLEKARKKTLTVAAVKEEYAADLQSGSKENHGAILAEGLKPSGSHLLQNVSSSLPMQEEKRMVIAPKNPLTKEADKTVVESRHDLALDFVAAGSKTPTSLGNVISAYERALLQKRFPFKELVEAADKLSIEVAFDSSKVSKGAFAEYHGDTNTIYINQRRFAEGKWEEGKGVLADTMFDSEIAAQAVMAIADRVEKTTETQDRIRLKSELIAFRQSVEPFLPQASEEVKRLYKLTGNNLNLTMAMATNPNFAEWLASIPDYSKKGEGKSFWHRLMNIVLRYVGKVTGMGRSKLDKLSDIMEKNLKIGSAAIQSAPNKTLSDARKFTTLSSYIKARGYVNTGTTKVMNGVEVVAYTDSEGKVLYEPVSLEKGAEAGWNSEKGAPMLLQQITELQIQGTPDSEIGRERADKILRKTNKLRAVVQPLSNENERLTRIWNVAHGRPSDMKIVQRDATAAAPKAKVEEGEKAVVAVATGRFKRKNPVRIVRQTGDYRPAGTTTTKAKETGIKSLSPMLNKLAQMKLNSLESPEKYRDPEENVIAHIERMYPQSEFPDNFAVLRAEEKLLFDDAVDQTLAERAAHKMVMEKVDEEEAARKKWEETKFDEKPIYYEVRRKAEEKRKKEEAQAQKEAQKEKEKPSNHVTFMKDDVKIASADINVVGSTAEIENFIQEKQGHLADAIEAIFDEHPDVTSIKIPNVAPPVKKTGRTRIIKMPFPSPYNGYALPTGVVDTHRFKGKDISNSLPGERGCLGNPVKATDAGGVVSRSEAVAEYRKLLAIRCETDPVFRDYVLSLRGEVLGYYKPELENHAQEIINWLEQHPDEKPEKLPQYVGTPNVGSRNTEVMLTQLGKVMASLGGHSRFEQDGSHYVLNRKEFDEKIKERRNYERNFVPTKQQQPLFDELVTYLQQTKPAESTIDTLQSKEAEAEWAEWKARNISNSTEKVAETPVLDSLSQYLAEARRYPMVEREEALELARKALKGDQKAAEKLVTSNLRLVVGIAKRILVEVNANGNILPDLVQEGNAGLIYSLKKFDPNRDIAFTTYATNWIEKAIRDYLMRGRNVVRVGTNAKQRSLYYQVTKAREELIREAWVKNADRAEMPTNADVAKYLGVTEKDVAEITSLLQQNVSGSALVNQEDENEGRIENQFESPDNTEEDFIRNEASIPVLRKIDNFRNTLSAVERDIFDNYILEPKKDSFAQIGARHGLGKTSIDPKHKEVLRKMHAFFAGPTLFARTVSVADDVQTQELMEAVNNHPIELPRTGKDVLKLLKGEWFKTKMPEAEAAALKNKISSYAGIHYPAIREIFSTPYNNSKTSKGWEKLYNILGVTRIAEKETMMHDWLRMASKFLNRREIFKKAGYTRKQIQDATERIGKLLTIGDEKLRERLFELRTIVAQAQRAEKSASLFPDMSNVELQKIRVAAEKELKWLEENRAYSFEEVQNGIKDWDGTVVTANELEYNMYLGVRKAEDAIFEKIMTQSKTMLLSQMKKQKWYKLLANMIGEDTLTDEQIGEIADRLQKVSKSSDIDKITSKGITIKMGNLIKQMNNEFDKWEAKSESKDMAGFYKRLTENFAKELEEFKSYMKDLVPEGENIDDVVKQMFVAYQRVRPRLRRLRDLRNDWNNWPGFFPRKREQGAVKMQMYELYINKKGVQKKREVFSQMFNSESEAHTIYGELLDRYGVTVDGKKVLPEKYVFEYPLASKLEESAFVGMKDFNIQALLDNAFSNMEGAGPYFDKEGMKVDLKSEIWDAAFDAIAGQFQARAAGAHGIHRKQKPGESAIKGYLEENHDAILISHITSMAGILSKQKAAYDVMEAMSELTDRSELPELRKYVAGQLRNTTSLDRVSSKFRATAFLVFLGGLVKSAAVNAIQPYGVGIPILDGYMRDRGIKGSGTLAQLKASKQVAVNASTMASDPATWGELDGIDSNEKQYIYEAIVTGLMTAQHIRFIKGQTSELGRVWNTVFNTLATPFAAVETFNRITSGLTMFRIALDYHRKENAKTGNKLSDAQCIKNATDDANKFINDVHYPVGSHNLPIIAQGGDVASIALKTAYTFRPFTHNFLLNQFNLLKSAARLMGKTDEQSRKQATSDLITFIHTMALLAMFGGLMGLPFLKDIFDWYESKFGYSPKEWVRETLRGIGGDTLETFGMGGIPAMLGGNISGSLAIGVPFIGNDSALESMGGVYSGLYKKLGLAGEAASRGDYYRVAANLTPEFLRGPIVALTESDFGKQTIGTRGMVTTPQGMPSRSSTGEILSYTGGEAAWKALGFVPTRIKKEREIEQSVKSQVLWANEKKKNISEAYRIDKLQNDPNAMKTVVKSINELNQDIKDRNIPVERAKLSTILENARYKVSAQKRREIKRQAQIAG